MQISLVGGVDDGSQQVNRNSNTNGGIGRNQRSGFRANNQQNGPRGGGGGGGNRPRGGRQQNGAGGNKKEELTAEDLDADLEAYRAESTSKK